MTEEELDLGVYVDSAIERQARMTGMGELVERVGPPLQAISVGIAVSNRLPEQLARLNSALLHLKAEIAFDNIKGRWFGPPKSWWTVQRLFFAYLGGIAVVVLISLGAYSRLRRAFRRGLNRETRLRAALSTRHAEMLEQKNAQLAAQNDEMQRLLQAVSHDLKSPMVTVRGFAGVLEDAMASGDQDLARDACRRIVVSTGHLSGITDGLQEFNRVDQKPVALRELDLAALIAETEEMLSADIAETEARIVVASELPNVRADETQLLRVLLNLILNALRHGCPEPGMTIEISAAKGAQVTEIVVRDHGPGVPEAFQHDVFRLFRRLAPGQADGSGIGLSIVARVAAKHGGSAWISSPEGGGAAVHFTLLNSAAETVDERATLKERAA
jgi:signal transduction histidine kinase